MRDCPTEARDSGRALRRKGAVPWRLSLPEWSCSVDRGNLARTRSTYAKELFARAPRDGNASQLSVFIIGTPRSGSTLVEQILSSHRDVHGAGAGFLLLTGAAPPALR